MTAEEFYFKWKNEHAGVRWKTHEMMEAYAEQQIKELKKENKLIRELGATKYFENKSIEQAEQIKELTRLVEIAKCPNCDGSEVIPLTSTFEVVEGEQPLADLEQCQFCDERKQALNQ